MARLYLPASASRRPCSNRSLSDRDVVLTHARFLTLHTAPFRQTFRGDASAGACALTGGRSIGLIGGGGLSPSPPKASAGRGGAALAISSARRGGRRGGKGTPRNMHNLLIFSPPQ